jgi:hypothetical protein
MGAAVLTTTPAAAGPQCPNPGTPAIKSGGTAWLFKQSSSPDTYAGDLTIKVYCQVNGGLDGTGIANAVVRITATDSPALPDVHLLVNGIELTHPLSPTPGYLDIQTDANGLVTVHFFSDTPGLETYAGTVATQWENIRSADGVDYGSSPYYAYTVQVDPSGAYGYIVGGGGGGTNGPLAVSPELDSILLFGAGALALFGYTALRRRRTGAAS